MRPEELILEAGKRAAWWYLDTGDCLFCDVDEAPAGLSHEEHCTFSGISKSALREWCDANPMKGESSECQPPR
jgi:hypothetical protein